MEFAGHVAFVALMLIFQSCHVRSQWVGDVDPFKLWPEGKPIPYEISSQYNSQDSMLIKAALEEIMKSTCIKFIPRTKKEDDYIVFMEYKALSQARGICWSGKWKDMGSEIGFQNGRHVVSLWRDLGCFNKFNIIYEVLRILGFDSNGSSNQGNIPDNKGYHRAYIHAVLLHGYEKQNLGINDPTTYLRISCDPGLNPIRRHPFAFDLYLKKPKTFVGKSPCNQLDDDFQLLTQGRLSIIKAVYQCKNASDKGVNVSDVNCYDENDNCPWWSEKGECKKNPSYMLWGCRASCKQCKMDVTAMFSDANCRDENENCPQWARTGGCKSNPKYMLWNCRASCKRCKSVAKDINCKDENENCPWWAEVGECHNNPSYMMWNCRHSCKQCEKGNIDKLDCKDFFPKDCPQWAAIDFCKRDPWVAKYCRISCKQCGNQTFPQLTVLEMDEATLFNLSPVSPNCTAEVHQGTCKSDPDYMRAICNDSVCENENRCTDKDKANCPSWAFKGDCEKNPELMNNNCNASCNVKCCEDNHADCGLWASKGQCVLKPAELLINCKRSCRNCEICKDIDTGECKKKAEMGECTKTPHYMTLYCPKSCKVCG